MITNARSRTLGTPRNALNTPPGGCVLRYRTAFINLGGFVRCWNNNPYFPRGFLVTPPGFTRWGFVNVEMPPVSIPVPLVLITAPIVPGGGGYGTSADGTTEVVVYTFKDAYRWFGGGGLAVIGDVKVKALIIAVEELGQAYFKVRIVVEGVNGRWVDVNATGWTSGDYPGYTPGGAFPLSDPLWDATAERYNECATGYQLQFTPGECNAATCPVAGGLPGWVGEPGGATTVSKPFAVSGVGAYAV